MGFITYTAVDNGELASGHSAGTEYKIATEFESFPRTLIHKGWKRETLDGTPEGYTEALQREYQIVTDIVLLADRPNWREFFTSVLGAQTFQIDFTGTIAVPVANVNLWLPDDRIPEPQLRGYGVRYSFKAKVRP